MAIRKVGSCRILRELGRGGMGVVYEAEQEGLDRRVAVKELPADLAKNEELAARFRREGRLHAGLRHQAIPAVHDLVEKLDALYLITEFVDGADLQKLLKQGGPLPPEVVAAIGARLAEALDHVHFHKLLHRDVKPPNVMLARDGAVKLMDFGIAKDVTADDLTRDGLVVGSPAYLAPEQLDGRGAGPESDLWALGVTLYELLTGQKPFRGKTAAELFLAIQRAKFPAVRALAPHVPRRLARLVERCLAEKPRRRPRSAELVAHELDAIATSLLRGAHPQARLARLLAERGFGAEEPARTVLGEASQLVTRSAEEGGLLPIPIPERRRPLWHWAVGLALALSAFGLAWGVVGPR